MALEVSADFELTASPARLDIRVPVISITADHDLARSFEMRQTGRL